MRKLLSFHRVDVEVDFCTQASSVHLCAVPGNVSVRGGPGSLCWVQVPQRLASSAF